MRTLWALLATLLLLPASAFAADDDTIMQAYEEAHVHVSQRTSTVNAALTQTSNLTSNSSSSLPAHTDNVGHEIQALIRQSSQQIRLVGRNRTLPPSARRSALTMILRATHASAMNIIRNMR